MRLSDCSVPVDGKMIGAHVVECGTHQTDATGAILPMRFLSRLCR